MAVLFSASRSIIDCYFNLNLGQNPSFSPEFSSVAHCANWFFGVQCGGKRGVRNPGQRPGTTVGVRDPPREHQQTGNGKCFKIQPRAGKAGVFSGEL